MAVKDTFRANVAGTRLRIVQAARWWPRRTRRLGRHLLRFCWRPAWWLDLVWLVLEWGGFCEFYETLLDWGKASSRPLRAGEEALLREVFGDSLTYARIRIDERAFLGPPQLRICYVSFYTINSWGAMAPDTLVHEAMHVWQFHHLGAVYIPRALAAQRSVQSYNYGGPSALRRHLAAGLQLLDYNYEQQADVVADYWRLRHGYHPRWGRAVPDDLQLYAEMCRVVRAPAFQPDLM